MISLKGPGFKIFAAVMAVASDHYPDSQAKEIGQ